jgi:hypothetical protein
MLMIDDKHKASGTVDDQFVKGFEQGLESSGVGKRDSGKFIEIAGIKAYERTGHTLVKGKNASTVMQVVPADGKLYSLQAMRLDGDASDDPEIRGVFASFRFLKPPAPPPSAAYRMGYLFGSLLPIIALGGAGAYIVLKAILRYRSKETPPSPPNAGR